MIAKQIEPSYLNLLELGNPLEASEDYFRNLLRRNLEPNLHSAVFIFNDSSQCNYSF